MDDCRLSQGMSFAFAAPPLLPQPSPGRRRVTFAPQCAAPTPSAVPLRTPNHRRVPVLSFLIDLLRRKIDNIALARTYGQVYNTGAMGVSVTVVTDLNAVNQCYKDAETFRSAGGYPPNFSTILGEKAIFVLDGAEHRNSRAKYLLAFSPQLFPLYHPAVQTSARVLWEQVHDSLRHSRRLCLEPLVRDHYLQLIVSLTTGSPNTGDSGVSADQFRMLARQFKQVADGIIQPPFSPRFREALRAREAILETLTALIVERMVTRADVIRALRAEGAERVILSARPELRAGKLDLLTMFCASSSLEAIEGANHDPVVLKELAEGVLVVWNAGYSTQGSSTLSCLMEGWLDEGILRRLQEEQNALVLGEGTREVSVSQVAKQTPLLDSFLTETLRMYPPATISFRRTAAEVMVCGHKIPAGQTVALDFWSAQRGDKYYPDPDTFVMDRFILGGSAPTPPAIASFGTIGGAHFCLGAALARMCIKTTLATLLREFDLVLDARQNRSYRSIPELCPRLGVIALDCRRRAENAEKRAT